MSDAVKLSKLGDRFWSKVNKDAPNGCWEWIAGRFKYRGGYGQYRLSKEKRTTYAHRVAYEDAYGPIGEGLVIDHMCHNPPCVNPDHLQAVPPALNSQNLSGPTSSTSTGVRNVYYDSKNRCYGVMLGSRLGRIWVGRFPKLEEAARAAHEARLEHYPNSLMDRRPEAGSFFMPEGDGIDG